MSPATQGACVQLCLPFHPIKKALPGPKEVWSLLQLLERVQCLVVLNISSLVLPFSKMQELSPLPTSLGVQLILPRLLSGT